MLVMYVHSSNESILVSFMSARKEKLGLITVMSISSQLFNELDVRIAWSHYGDKSFVTNF